MNANSRKNNKRPGTLERVQKAAYKNSNSGNRNETTIECVPIDGSSNLKSPQIVERNSIQLKMSAYKNALNTLFLREENDINNAIYTLKNLDLKEKLK